MDSFFSGQALNFYRYLSSWFDALSRPLRWGARDEPLWAEVFSPERLEQHAESLAQAQTTGDRRLPWFGFARRIADNERVLIGAHEAIAAAVDKQSPITPAAEWLLNNFHIVEEQVRDVRSLLPSGFFRELPALDSGPLTGMPRIYGIAWAFTAHTDSHFDAGLLQRFVAAYQRVQPLTLAELWALPIMLRIVMIENLRRLAARIVESIDGRERADRFADELLALDPGSFSIEPNWPFADDLPLPRASAAQLYQRLRYADVVAAPVLMMLTERLAREGTDPEEVVRLEVDRQTAADLSVRNLITSLRLISSFEWQQFVEAASLVHRALCAAPLFSSMDFITRDRYRHAVEQLARRAPLTELEVARAAVNLAAKASPATDARLHDAGYYLIGDGRPTIEAAIGYRVPILRRLFRLALRSALPLYLGALLLLTGIVLAIVLPATGETRAAGPDALLLLATLAIFPASDIAINVVNRLVGAAIAPRHLPRLELAAGIPVSMRTFVVVPTMLGSEESIAEQVHHLETRYLSSVPGEIYFALLTDWPDSESEQVPEDRAQYDFAVTAIRDLNRRYPPGRGETIVGHPHFYLFHRRRLWNPVQRRWMGWERKRGKLQEFNRLLRGAQDTSFLVDAHFVPPPAGVRFVLTLDADTVLPIGAAAELVGTLAHPLNRPRFGASGQVLEGYSILQPRITPALPTRAGGTRFQQLFSGNAGVDPYTFQVSDVYQDLFGEGTFTGKGLYDVDAFEAALAGRTPENAILSHDLFEGSFARCAFVSDVELFEEFPSHTGVADMRSHRWVRGDWQLLPWICGPRFRGLPALARWKMTENLRRSLSPLAMFLMLVVSWVIPELPLAPWIALALAALLLPQLLPLLERLAPEPHLDRGHWLRSLRSDLVSALARAGVTLALLPHRAWLTGDAIARTLIRLARHRNLLEWNTSAQVQAAARLSARSFVANMLAATLTIPAIGVAAYAAHPDQFGLVLPFLVLWLLAPLIAWRISTPPAHGAAGMIEPADVAALRLIARRTWLYFTTFVTRENHFLPPDNFQEDPVPVVAHRSSPTNFGLYLLSVVAARDFGWISLREMASRLEATLDGMDGLPRHRGHFLNWVDTLTLRPLEPRYVSSVDSGNLAALLLLLAQACLEAVDRPLDVERAAAGIRDELALLKASLTQADERRGAPGVGFDQLHDALHRMDALLESPPQAAADGFWEALDAAASDLHDIVQTLDSEGKSGELREAALWAEALRLNVGGHRRDQVELAPGLAATGREAPGDGRAPSMSSSTSGSAAPFDPEALDRSRHAVEELFERLYTLSRRARQLFEEMDFRFLYDESRDLFSIGYLVEEGRLDLGCYDLLASEARLTSFITIAKRDVPVKHWFRLGRTLVPVDGGAALVSWSGSMFEYLMPSLLMATPHGSLLETSLRRVVARQISFGRERDVPWGVSESAYNARDIHLTYQYSNFGVPGLGLKRGLGKDTVVAPYATALAAMYDAKAAVTNFERLAARGALGRYGFYEALDFTASRLPKSDGVAVVRAYMAHHQGMTLVALANVALDGEMRHRFHRIPMVQATELLLQETAQRDVTLALPRSDRATPAIASSAAGPLDRRVNSPHAMPPATQLLSNGRYGVMVTAAGSGYSRWRDLAVTRWREDPTRDCWGTYLYLRDRASGYLWSAGYQPVCVEPVYYEAEFAEDRVRILRADAGIESSLEIMVTADDDAEIRRLTLRNTGSRPREIEITSYAEIVLATPASDEAHPVFSNLFVQTEYVPQVSGLLATRRQRSPADEPLWAAHVVAFDAGNGGGAGIEFETDRAKFLGRGRTVQAPLALMEGRRLSNTVGAVLDPIASLRINVAIAPGATVHASFTTMTASSREVILNLADKYHDPGAFDRASTLAWTHAQVKLHYLGITGSEAQIFQQLASRVLYSNALLRGPRDVMQRSRLPVSELWKFGISGDRPILLARIEDSGEIGVIRQLLTAHEYLHVKRLGIDLVILNEQSTSYAEGLQQDLELLVRESNARKGADDTGGRGVIYILRADHLSEDEAALLLTAARVVITCRQGNLAAHLALRQRDSAPHVHVQQRVAPATSKVLPPPPLQFPNGLGGFTDGGREYAVVLNRGQRTPLPWINIVANDGFGFQASESGAGYTWASNSRENQLTPWSNDPVTDPAGEAFYLLDRDSGILWTPTALPIRVEEATYIARFGHGYARFQNRSNGIESELLQFVASDDPVKISRLRLVNHSSHTRRISITAYVEWVLGFSRTVNAPFVVTEVDAETGAVFAINPWNREFGSRVAFAAWDVPADGLTCDRQEFLGRNGHLAAPACLAAASPLSGRYGAGFDPCVALQREVELGPEAQLDLIFVLGQAVATEPARELIRRYCTVAEADAEFLRVRQQWREILDRVQVETPDPQMNLILNHWLLYQTIACRIYARSAFYQAGGAYGFRDQLQDVMALAIARPDLTRRQIVNAASHQFREGDVQHWWHPPTGRGVRTHFADDRVWLPYCLNHYLAVTGDTSVLDERVPFVVGASLPPEREALYLEPTVSDDTVSVYEHCARALDISLDVGQHELPLMRGGDWNDGMNRVGAEGRGESIWLAWFLCATLREFAPLAAERGERERAQAWSMHADRLQAAVEREAWDGAWYRRAYFDDGTPLGAAGNPECRIDSLTQSWALISGAGEPARARRAMESVGEHLVRPGDSIVLLFAPPFDRSSLEPGYIKGYLPGVRENGAQYTQAAVWCVIAHALQGDGERAAELFEMLNPINHGSTRAGIHRYKAEPFVIAADVYSEPPHTGRGGWSWYTGAAGWMYRAGLEFILGFKRRGAELLIDPCIPEHWRSFKIRYRAPSATYELVIENPQGVARGVSRVELDGAELPGIMIPLLDDAAVHSVRVTLGPVDAPPLRP
ncbi:MAG TPA: glucoamylase family protein [Burkholderiaceae bacterium]|nr:glucoamylase family protein [Burkholderiaceae bacterium]